MEQRGEIERVIEDSPSLRQTVGAVVVKEIIPARRQVSLALTGHGGAPRIDPARLGYTEAEVMGDWFPGAA